MEQQLECFFDSEDGLYAAYMPFVKGGGLFIRTAEEFTLGTPIQLSVQLLNEPERFFIDAKVIWITPKDAQGKKPKGIGVQFLDESSRVFCNKIENYLTGMLKSSRPTDTL